MDRPSPGRVSGMVKESPDRLEYEVALYREVTSRSGEALTPRQAVPIGSKLQLRASINAQSSKHGPHPRVSVFSETLRFTWFTCSQQVIGGNVQNRLGKARIADEPALTKSILLYIRKKSLRFCWRLSYVFGSKTFDLSVKHFVTPL